MFLLRKKYHFELKFRWQIERLLITIYGLRILTGDRANQEVAQGVELHRKKASNNLPTHQKRLWIQGSLLRMCQAFWVVLDVKLERAHKKHKTSTL
jgi:hypothetical protein